MAKYKALSPTKAAKYAKELERRMENVEEFSDDEYVPECYTAGFIKGILVARNLFWEIARKPESD